MKKFLLTLSLFISVGVTYSSANTPAEKISKPLLINKTQQTKNGNYKVESKTPLPFDICFLLRATLVDIYTDMNGDTYYVYELTYYCFSWQDIPQ